MSTNKSYLPPKGKQEADDIIKRFLSSSVAGLGDMAQDLHYKNVNTLKEAMRKHYGITIKAVFDKPTKEDQPIIISLPEIKLREYKPLKSKQGDEEIAVLHCGDGHAGKITKSFNDDVYNEDMDTLFDATMIIISLHRRMYPIKTLRIINCGDNVQGENPHQGSKIGAVKMGVRDQIAKLAFPAWVRLICSLKQEFETVVFEGFAGNHGWDKLAPETSRADLSLYDLIKAKIGEKKGITINIHEDFGDVLKIWDWRFFVAHLDGIPCNQGIPYFAIDRALKAWYMQFGGFDYALGGHFHKKHLGDEVSAVLRDFFMCSTLVSDDDWALKKLKISSRPSQNLMGVHIRKGVTWRYPLIVERKELVSLT